MIINFCSLYKKSKNAIFLSLSQYPVMTLQSRPFSPLIYMKFYKISIFDFCALYRAEITTDKITIVEKGL